MVQIPLNSHKIPIISHYNISNSHRCKNQDVLNRSTRCCGSKATYALIKWFPFAWKAQTRQTVLGAHYGGVCEPRDTHHTIAFYYIQSLYLLFFTLPYIIYITVSYRYRELERERYTMTCTQTVADCFEDGTVVSSYSVGAPEVGCSSLG